MPQYDFRCNACQLRFSVTYRSYGQYDAAALLCPECGSAELARVIRDVVVRKSARDFRKMSSNEMLSVLESGDQRQVKEMFKQVGGEAPADSATSPPDERKGSQPATGPD